jgi:hypothetical protein
MPVLRFAVIPTKVDYETYSQEIVDKIGEIQNCKSELNTSYDETLTTRVNKYKKLNRNIVTIGLSEVEHNTLMIHFIGSRPKTMELDEFVELLMSFEDNESSDESESDGDGNDSSDDDVIIFSKDTKKKKKTGEQKKKTDNDEEQDDTSKGEKEGKGEKDDEDGCIIM